jgi:hypothetical protein
MKEIIKIVLAFLLLPVLASAQSNYKAGYVINLKGDTLKGFINYKEWNQNPSTNPYYFLSFNTPIVLKAGIRLHKKLELYASYVSGSPVSDDEIIRLSFSSFQTGVNYYFK